MKKLFFLKCCLILFLIFNNADAQKIIKKVKETAKQTTEQKAEQKTAEGLNQGVDKAIDKSIKGVKSVFKKQNDLKENKKEQKDNDPDLNSDNKFVNEELTGKNDFGIYSKFTFEPGNKILYYDDFAKDGIGDFPAKWETSGNGKIVTTSEHQGKWLLLTGRSGYLPSTGELPENYTIEFDLLTNGFLNNNAGTSLLIAFLKKKSYKMGSAGGHAHLKISLHKTGKLSISNSGAENSPRINTLLDQKFLLDQLVHFSLAINKNRLRIWMNEEKIVDIPSILIGNMGRYVLIEAYDINTEKGQTVLISNFKVAESKEDLRSQLLENGRFSTTGIYFNTDKTNIKPESFAIIKSVADFLKENPEVKIKIIGHTDAQGKEEYNQQLSEKRANAVLQALISQFEIEENRLSANGKGESEPIDDNTTEKGRANNRRVEFVKL